MPSTPGSGGSRIVIDCGQTGSRLRIDDGPDRDAAPVYTDRPVVEQVAALAREAVSLPLPEDEPGLGLGKPLKLMAKPPQERLRSTSARSGRSRWS